MADAVSGGIVVRPPRAGDGEGLARAWLDAGTYYARLNPDQFQVPDASGLAESFEQYFPTAASAPNRCYLVAERDGSAVGSISATIEPPAQDAARQLVRDVGRTRVTISALVVQEAHRRAGIGTRLMDAVEAWARARGAAVILLDTYLHSPLSVPFYEQQMGYTRSALQFRKALDR